MKRTTLSLIFLFFATIGILAQTSTKLEAENANYVNCKLIQDSKYSGGKALEITEENAKITFTYNQSEKGKYIVYVGYDGLHGDKVVNLAVNGSNGIFTTKGRAETAVGTFFMNKGNNTIIITPGWTWFRIDYIRIEKDNSISLPFNISPAPVDPQATANAKKVYSFLYNNFGKKDHFWYDDW